MSFNIGDLVRLSTSTAMSTGGCLVRFADRPKRILLMCAAHGLVRKAASPGDIIIAVDDDQPIGLLQTWTTFRASVLADVALVWVHPKRVRATPTSGTALKPPGGPLGASQRVTIVGGVSAPGKTGTIASPSADVPLPVNGPGWHIDEVFYARQMICQPMFTRPGDSGAVVLDENGALAGMVVAARGLVETGDDWVSQSIITPIAAILTHPDFGGRRLELVTTIPSDAEVPALL